MSLGYALRRAALFISSNRWDSERIRALSGGLVLTTGTL
jgi:hypothetical protein